MISGILLQVYRQSLNESMRKRLGSVVEEQGFLNIVLNMTDLENSPF